MSEATVTSIKNDNWTNRHETVTQSFDRLYFIELPDGDGTTIIKDMRTSATAMQQILRNAISEKKRLRCIGGAWSLSNCAATNGWLLSTQSLNLYYRIMEKEQIHSEYKGDIAGLYFSQCGASVQEMNKRTARHGRSLITSGASNGQTMAGAIATGTHGSAFHYGSMPEYVVGFHLIIGPDEIIWLERASYPVVSDKFAEELGVTIKRDDDLFNAVLVSFGSCGITAGIMIETEPVFLFESERRHLVLNADMKNAMNTMTFANLDLPNAVETPWHFEVTFNPHKKDLGYVRTLFKRPFTTSNYKKPEVAGSELSPGEGLLGVVSSLTSLVGPRNVARLVGILVQKHLSKYGPKLGTTEEIFGTTFTRGKAMSMELGISMENSSRVLDIMLGLPEKDVYAGVISYRWVKQTSAMLGWTKFPITATIEFNASYNFRTLNLYNRIWAELEAQGIEYTLHWGQMHNFTPERVRRMYGDATIDKWKTCRSLLLSEAVREVFGSEFMSSTGLG